MWRNSEHPGGPLAHRGADRALKPGRMFVRGLQATYNAYSQRTGLQIPDGIGSILVFGLSCGQIMFAFLLSPETIPPEYNSWYVLWSACPRCALTDWLGL